MLPLPGFESFSSDGIDLFRLTDGRQVDLSICYHSNPCPELANPDRTQVVPNLAGTLSHFPRAGSDFLGFHLLEELGAGAFGRVYLAQQGDLANRLVALKITTDASCETNALAQLQHTNIVPIYSVHRSGPFHAICMPYFGATTLTDLLKDLKSREQMPASATDLLQSATMRASTTVRSQFAGPAAQLSNGESKGAPFERPTSNAIAEMLVGRTYVEGVVWLISCLADGLAHAHERGILHHDLKPANVLFTDEGQPMLLDFNLSEDIKQGPDLPAFVGGTLPYMAPEHLRAYLGEEAEKTGPAADVYSLGIIFFELLTRQHPFTIPKNRAAESVREMLRERTASAPDVRKWNPAISPAIASIVTHCLEPDSKARYQNARQLHEDLHRFMNHFPLRHACDPSLREKVRRWKRRHPRMVAAGLAVILSTAFFAPAIGVRTYQVAKQQAVTDYKQFREEAVGIQCKLASSIVNRQQLPENVGQALKLLSRYASFHKGQWAISGLNRLTQEQQGSLLGSIAETAMMIGQAERLMAVGSEESAQREKHFRMALAATDLAAECYIEAPRAVQLQRIQLLRLLGENEKAEELREMASLQASRTVADFLLDGSACFAERKFQEAVTSLDNALKMDPQHGLALFLKGICHKQMGEYIKAEACFSSCAALAPDSFGSYFLRGITYARHGNFAEAREDLNQAAAKNSAFPDTYVERAEVRAKLGDFDGAIEDLGLALKAGAPFVATCMQRAKLREQAGDIVGAKRDRALAVRAKAVQSADWLAVGWPKRYDNPKEALADIERALKLNPLSQPSLHAKAFILSKIEKKPEEAIATLDRLVSFFPDDATALRLRGLLNARLGNRNRAIADAEATLELDSGRTALYQVACIYSQTSLVEPEDAKKALLLLAKALEQGYGNSLISHDEDLNPLRKDTRFQQLVTSTRNRKTRSRG